MESVTAFRPSDFQMTALGRAVPQWMFGDYFSCNARGLDELVGHGLMESRRYPEPGNQRLQYRVLPAGTALRASILAERARG